MQQEATNAKQLIVERIRQSTNILVAVSTNPSVDALAGALGLALSLNKMDKHATAVFSGQIPPAIEFLSPGKTFENSVDSLRDFIISLDKEKADRLRYKVENDVVRIFITPYRTVIGEKDLQFSQGDFNVDLIIGLGVQKREDLDKAIIAHGRILHDATVMTINTGSATSNLGAVDWNEASASSLCEMLVSLTEAFQQPDLLDSQIATSLLTGIVAATDRFSNQATTPKVMTMAAQLMAAGANQQLIANNLLKARSTPALQVEEGDSLIPGAQSVKVADVEEPAAKKEKEKGELDIVHSKSEEKRQAQPSEPQPQEKPRSGKKMGSGQRPARNLSLEKPKVEAKQPEAEEESSWRGRRLEPPTLGGTLNATTEEAMEETRKAEKEVQNQQLLSHDEENAAKSKAAPVEPPTLSKKDTTYSEEPLSVAAEIPPLQSPALPQEIQPVTPAAPEIPEAPAPTLAPQEVPISPQPASGQGPEEVLEAARDAVNEALQSQPFNPAGQPLQSVGALPLGVESSGQQEQVTSVAPQEASAPLQTPEIPEPTPVPATVSPLPESTPSYQSAEAPAMPQPGADISLPPLPPMPPLPDQMTGQLPPPPSLDALTATPQSPAQAEPLAPPPANPAPPVPPAPSDPKQFQIPS